ncbi:MAG: hypothetical protein WCT03_14985 [Candidatus Obscuribacterales bacterium]|jgi:hypothetical protein
MSALGENQRACHHISCLLLLAIISWSGLPAFSKTHEVKSLPATKRTLHFPKAVALGVINLGNESMVFGGHFQNHAVAGAMGDVTITVPAGQRVIFEANRRVFENPKYLDQISPVGIDGLKLGMISLADREDDMCDAALAHVVHFQGLTEINVDRSEATDAGLAKLKDVPSLVLISCFLSSIDGRCFKELSTLPNLRALFAPYCQLKPENLRYLGQFPALQFLNLDWTHLGVAGAKYLSLCSRLEDLSVRGNVRFTDSCLLSIPQLKKLKKLDLRGTSVTVSGVRKLKGMELKMLLLPADMRENLVELRKVFPKTAMSTEGERVVDKQDKMLYAPLH